MLIFSGIGNIIAPPIGNAIAESSATLPFLFWGGMALAAMIGLYMAREGRGAAEVEQPAPVESIA